MTASPRVSGKLPATDPVVPEDRGPAADHRAWTTFTGWSRGRQRISRSPRLIFTALSVLAIVTAVLAVLRPSWVAPSLMVVPMLAGAALLPMGWLLALTVVCLAMHGVVVVLAVTEARVWSVPAAYLVIVGLVLMGARARSRLGTQGSRGESMLFDLRERLTSQGELPTLPSAWRAEIVHRSAHGASFGGDFFVSALATDESRLEMALVDVSGKGIEAGTRALMLSGAFGGLLGSVPPDRFLVSANDYLLRQRWDEGFATGVHVAIDLGTGQFDLGSAGHPPAAQFHAGSGSWEVGAAAGPALGLMSEPHFETASGQLLPGDALLLYTDGLVETPDRDISVGIDRLLGEAERLVTGGFESGANRLMLAVPDTESDDRACVLVWRT